MERLYTAAQVRALDARAIGEHGIPGIELMERAGKAVFDDARRRWPGARRWLVLCGGGNNGGDGYIVARRARAAGLEVQLCALSDPERLGGDAAEAAARWRAEGGATARWPVDPDAFDLAVDAMLGTGLDREVGGVYREAVEALNASGAPVLAVDVPSGLGADTGRRMGHAVRADATVTFIGRKRGLYTADGPDCTGAVVFDDLGTPAAIHKTAENAGITIRESILDDFRGPRARNSHKGHYGHVGVLGGHPGMSGAARLAGEAALRAGAGLVTVATHPEHAALLNVGRPELMVAAVSGAEQAANALTRCTVLAAGPGLGGSRWSRDLLAFALGSPRPLVLDADGLNLLAENPLSRDDWVLTPHPAEAARLLGCATDDVQADRFAAAAQVAERFGAVTVLKGCGTVVAAPDGRYGVCTLGNPGMATGGSGDVLTGVVAALLAQGLGPWRAAACAVAAHAGAGDRAAARIGERGLLAGDIVDALPGLLNPAPRPNAGG